MTVRRTSAAALLALLATGALLAYVFRRQLLDLAVLLFCGRMGYHAVRHHFHLTKPTGRSNRKTWLEVGGAALAGFLFARKTKDAVAEAVRAGAEVQVVVKPRSRYVSR